MNCWVAKAAGGSYPDLCIAKVKIKHIVRHFTDYLTQSDQLMNYADLYRIPAPKSTVELIRREQQPLCEWI